MEYPQHISSSGTSNQNGIHCSFPPGVKSKNDISESLWQLRIYPDGGSSTLPYGDQPSNATFIGSPLSSRLDFSSFINSMDDASFAYFSLIREYASRPLQGNALQYEGLYKAMVSQRPQVERSSRFSVIEFRLNGSRSRTFAEYDNLRTYLGSDPVNESSGRLFVLEDLPVRVVCLLGSRLGIHPSIFACHYSTEDSSTMSDGITALPSRNLQTTLDGLEYASVNQIPQDDKKRRFTLRYPITMPRVSAKQHPDPQICPHWLKPSSRLMDQSAYPNFIVERGLDTPSLHDKWDARGEVSELEGQVTYWSQILPSGGWNSEYMSSKPLKQVGSSVDVC
jgi:hypothetical protein